MPIKSFKGLMTNGSQNTILLHTNNGTTGYRIKKFRAMASYMGHTGNTEGVFSIWSVKQTSVATSGFNIEFNNQELLGTAVCWSSTDVGHYGADDSVIFDNVIFNQDIYVTYTDENGQPGNYYIELEQVKLDLGENTVATLKDIRNITGGTALV